MRGSPPHRIFRAVTRTARLLLLAIGFGIVVLLVWRAGVRMVADMLARVGWGFAAVAVTYAMQLAIRATALWRSILSGGVRYADVLRIRISGEAVEKLTLTGPFLAEPAKGWLLTRRGLAAADAFAAVATEYLLYTVASSWLAAIALSLLLVRGSLPTTLRPAAVVVLVLTIAFIGAFTFAATTGIGLIVPIVRGLGVVAGTSRAERAAEAIEPVERVLITFLHAHPARLAQVFAMEAAAQMLLMLEIWIVIAALGLPRRWTDPIVVEGGVKFVDIAFSFVPGQVGVSEGTFALLFSAIGLPSAAGLTLALVRRIRALLVAAAGLAAFAWVGDDE